MIARYAPVELHADASKLSAGDQKALAKLLDAARVIDDIFLQASLERECRAAGEAGEGHVAFGQSPAALFRSEQGAVVGAG